MGKILLVVLLLAVATYLLIRVIERRGLRSSEPRRPLGPDDDPDFLRRLGRHPDDDR